MKDNVTCGPDKMPRKLGKVCKKVSLVQVLCSVSTW